MFFSSLKLQYCRTIVLLNKLKLFEETCFSKATMVMRFPAKKNVVAQKHRTISRQKKDGILHPRSGCLGTSLPLPQSLYGRTLESQPKFFGSIDYQICLAMELRWRALPAGFAKKYSCKLPRRKEGPDFFWALTRKIDTGLPALVVALCSNRSKFSDRNRMPCKRS